MSERKFPARAVYQGNSLWSRSGRSVYEIFDEVSHGLRHFGLPVQDLVQEFLGERIPLVCLVDNQQAITPVKREKQEVDMLEPHASHCDWLTP